MPAGLETYYANGKVQLTLTDRIAKYIKSGSLGNMVTGQSARVDVPGMRNDGTWFAFATELTVTIIYDGYFIVTRTDFYPFPPEPHNTEVFYSVIRQ